MRYYFEQPPGESYEIGDRQSGRNGIAAASQGEPAPEQYAIVARVFDRSMEKNVSLIAGVADLSTRAASKFLTNEAYVRAAWTKAPPHWPKKNVELGLKVRPHQRRRRSVPRCHSVVLADGRFGIRVIHGSISRG